MMKGLLIRWLALPGMLVLFLVQPLLGGEDMPVPREDEATHMLGQMIMVGFRGTGDDANAPEFRALLEHIRAGRVGGVIVFDKDVTSRSETRNITGPEQLKRLTTRLHAAAPDGHPLFVAVDEEGGAVQRLTPKRGFERWPSPKEMGSMDDATVRQYGKRMGDSLREYGFNVDFAPSLDVDVNPSSPVIGALGRAFSSSPRTVAEKAGAFAEGLNEAGMIACFKHFPGHGSALTDTHHAFTDITATWQREELLPYEVLLPQGDARMVMVGHLFLGSVDAQLPGSLSEKTITGLLRGTLGWNGVVVSDDMQMGALTGAYSLEQRILLAVNAGTDLLVFGNNVEYDPDLAQRVYGTLLRLYRDGRISSERVRASYERIMELKQHMP